MAVQKISFREWVGGLQLKGPPENTPQQALRRATGIAPLRGGSLRSRSGGVLFYDIDAVAMQRFNGFRILAQNVSGLWFAGGLAPGAGLIAIPGAPSASGGQRPTFMEIPAQFLATNPNQNAALGFVEQSFLFVADGATPWKLDSSFHPSFWGIAAPSAAAVNAITVAVLDAYFTPIAAFDVTNGADPTKTADPPEVEASWHFAGVPAVVGPPATPAFTADFVVPRTVDNGSLRLFAPQGTETIATRSFAPSLYTPLDLTTFTRSGTYASSVDIGTVPGANPTSVDEDYIQFFTQVSKPKHCKSVEVKFFVAPSAGFGGFDNTAFTDPNDPSPSPDIPYQHYYSISLSVQVVKKKRRKNLVALGDLLPSSKSEVKKFLRDNPNGVAPDIDMQQFLHDLTIAVARNTWTKVTIPKALFDRAGLAGQPGFDWSNVVGMQVGVEANNQGGCTAWFDQMTLQGGVGTRGDYLWTITYRNDNSGSRSNPPTTTDANGNTLPITIPTPALTLDRQGALLSGFPAVLSAPLFDDGREDDQVTHVELWRTIGNGNPGQPNNPLLSPSSMTFFLVDKVPIGTTTFADRAGDYPGMHSLQGAKFLDPNSDLTFDNAPPPRSMSRAVYHPASGRVFALDNANPQRILYSAAGRPESLGSVGFAEPGGPQDPLRAIVLWNDTVVVFSNDRVYVGQGTDEPFVFTAVSGAPGCFVYKNTPVATPQGIFYVSRYGPRVFDGSTSRPIADDGLAPIFRGSPVEDLTAFGPSAVASFGRGEYWLSDLTNQTLIYDLDHDAWRNLNRPLNLIVHEPESTIVFGSFLITGRVTPSVNAIEGDPVTGEQMGDQPGEATNDAPNPVITGVFDIKTASVFLGGESIGCVRMLYVEADTQGLNVFPTLTIDGATYALAPMNTTGKQRVEWNVNIPGSIVDVRLAAQGMTHRMEISSIELEVYVSPGVD